METLPTLFSDFLQEIRPTEAKQDYIEGHKTLRSQLHDSDSIDDIYVADFLQGSYQRSTALKPVKGKKSDVDIVFVTNIPTSTDPGNALDKCVPFLEEHYPDDKWSKNNRSFEIERENVELDLVLTAAPSEATETELTEEDSVSKLSVEDSLDMDVYSNALGNMGYESGIDSDDWQVDPLDIPNQEENRWDKTHPLYVGAWTTDKNQRTNGHYVNVVKCIKWWNRIHVEKPKRPKGYPLEHIVGTCCPDGIESVAEGITKTFEQFERAYRTHAQQEESPRMADRALPSQNVLARLEGEDFADFYYQAVAAGKKAKEALEEDDPNAAQEKWTLILGDDFPEYGRDNQGDDSDDDDDDDGYEATNENSNVDTERYAHNHS